MSASPPDGEHPAADAVQLLRAGRLTVTGQLTNASNTTLFGAVTAGAETVACVYKPIRGERPLWDFPDGTLAARELAAYLVSQELGWRVVPPTVLRDGPFGEGMVQWWIESDPQVDLVALIRGGSPALRRMAVFDAVINNADRKGGHLLPLPSGHVYGVDHGVSFHTEDKLRTVLWNWAGQPVPEELLRDLAGLGRALDGALGARLEPLLTPAELAATTERVAVLLRTGCHPEPSGQWPPVPWPPF